MTTADEWKDIGVARARAGDVAGMRAALLKAAKRRRLVIRTACFFAALRASFWWNVAGTACGVGMLAHPLVGLGALIPFGAVLRNLVRYHRMASVLCHGSDLYMRPLMECLEQTAKRKAAK